MATPVLYLTVAFCFAVAWAQPLLRPLAYLTGLVLGWGALVYGASWDPGVRPYLFH